MGPKGDGSPSFPGLRMPFGSSAALVATSTSKAGPSASATNRLRFSPTPWWWLIAAGVTTLAFLVLVTAKRLLTRNIGRIAKRTRTQWDDVVEQTLSQTRTFWLFIVALTIGSRLLELGANAALVIRYAAVFLTVLQVGFWGRALIFALIDRHVKRERDTDPGAPVDTRVVEVRIRLDESEPAAALSNLQVDVRIEP